MKILLGCQQDYSYKHMNNLLRKANKQKHFYDIVYFISEVFQITNRKNIKTSSIFYLNCVFNDKNAR